MEGPETDPTVGGLFPSGLWPDPGTGLPDLNVIGLLKLSLPIGMDALSSCLRSRSISSSYLEDN